MAETASEKKVSNAKAPRRPKIEPVPEPERSSEKHPAPTCTVGFCPICLAVTAVKPMRPDVLDHLLNAGSEFLLAVRSLIDARAAEVGEEGPTKLERIDIG
jgi:hypothetical protein